MQQRGRIGAHAILCILDCRPYSVFLIDVGQVGKTQE